MEGGLQSGIAIAARLAARDGLTPPRIPRFVPKTEKA